MITKQINYKEVIISMLIREEDANNKRLTKGEIESAIMEYCDIIPEDIKVIIK